MKTPTVKTTSISPDTEEAPKKSSAGFIGWPPLIPGVLVKRYKRFLADVILDTGEAVTAHCPNSGSMKDCCEPGRPVFLSFHDNPKRKLKYTWEMIDMGTSLVGVNTLVPNRLAAASVEAGVVAELRGYETLRREVAVGKSSRIDLMLKSGDECCYVEVKNCTMVRDRIGLFPDAVTARGLKHLVELQQLVREGHRCVMFYLIQRTDADLFGPADAIDPAYGKELRRAVANGVEIIAYDTAIDLSGIRLNRPIECRLSLP